MSSNTKSHYENHLSAHYTWMLGNFEERLKQSKEFFIKHAITPRSNSIVIDLGAGSGLQSIPLAGLGFKVKAVDFSKKLLNELDAHAIENIETIEGDITDPSLFSGFEPELIICMGDTLTHLDSYDQVQKLIYDSYNTLSMGGKLILSFRDLTHELKGDDRFIPVKSDPRIIFTCFLEYFPGFVKVHDIIHENTERGWIQKVSSYIKLRLSLTKLSDYALQSGFKIVHTSSYEGFAIMICEKQL